MSDRRIVSLVPSLTQTLCEAGLKSQIVGITSFCVDPPDLYRLATVVGGTKDPNLEVIRRLNPTHILANEEENKPVHLKVCAEIAPTLITFPKTPVDVSRMFIDISSFLGDSSATECLMRWSKLLDDGVIELQHNSSVRSSGVASFLYLIWRNPWMAAGPDSYISQSLALAGFHNVLPDSQVRYPSLTPEEIVALNPSHIFFSSEPYPFRKRDLAGLQQECRNIPACQFYWIDGKLLSWFGSETLRLMSFLRQKWPPTAGDHLKCWNKE